jgi:hypothetical protein
MTRAGKGKGNGARAEAAGKAASGVVATVSLQASQAFFDAVSDLGASVLCFEVDPLPARCVPSVSADITKLRCIRPVDGKNA